MNRVLLLTLVGLAVGLRVHNAWVAPPLSGFDGPYHGAYIGAIVWDGHYQLPHWFSNHPPLYYATSAVLWKLLAGDPAPHTVLFVLRLLNVALGLAAAGAIRASARRAFPQRARVADLALLLALFLPMHIGPSTVLGNQMMSTALGALAIALLLRCLARPGLGAAAWAGAAAGLGVLTKLSVGIIVAVAGLALLARGWQLHGARPRALALAAALGLAAAVAASPYFVANLVHRGAPMDPAVDLWAKMDRSHRLPPRPWRDYVDPDPVRLLDPGRLGTDGQRAVWPVTFASTWFDLFGTVVDAHHPNARRGARVLFGFGAAFLLAAGVGAVVSLRRRVRSPVPFAMSALGLLVLVNLASYVAFTRAVPTYGALKGTYWSPAVSALVLFSALGIDYVAARTRVGGRAVAIGMTTFALAVTALYWHGGLAPMRVNPADLVLRDYSDPPTLRVFRFFVGRAPGRGPAPGLSEPAAAPDG